MLINILKTGLILFLSVIVAIFAVYTTYLPLKFILVVVFAGLFILLSLFFEDKTVYFLFWLAFFIPINITKTIYTISSSSIFFDNRLTVSIYDVFLLVLYFFWGKDVFVNTLNCRYKILLNKRISLGMPIFLPLFYLFILTLLSSFYAFDKSRVFIIIYYMIKNFLLYFYLINNLNSLKKIKTVIWGIFFNLFFQFVFTFLQVITKSSFGMQFMGMAKEGLISVYGSDYIFRAGGLMGHSNVFADYLSFSAILLLSLVFIVKKKYFYIKITAFFLLPLILFAIFFTYSRGGWISLFIAGVFLVSFILKRFYGDYKIVRTILFILIIFIAFIIYSAPNIIERLTQNDGGAMKTRFLQFEVAKNIIKDNPVLGVGANNYQAVMEKYDDTPSKISRYFKAPVHNVYLLVASELGIVGLLGLLWLFTMLIVIAYSNLIRCSDNLLFFINIGILFGFIAYFIHSAFDMFIPFKMPFIYFYMSIIVAIGGRGKVDYA